MIASARETTEREGVEKQGGRGGRHERGGVEGGEREKVRKEKERESGYGRIWGGRRLGGGCSEETLEEWAKHSRVGADWVQKKWVDWVNKKWVEPPPAWGLFIPFSFTQVDLVGRLGE